MDEDELKLPCLYNFVDLQRLCESQNVQLSTETNRYMLSLTFKKIGPTLSQKLIQKCKFVEDGSKLSHCVNCSNLSVSYYSIDFLEIHVF